MEFFRGHAAKRPKNSRDGSDGGTPRWSMGVLNDKDTIEVPGESQCHGALTSHPPLPADARFQGPFSCSPATATSPSVCTMPQQEPHTLPLPLGTRAEPPPHAGVPRHGHRSPPSRRRTMGR